MTPRSSEVFPYTRTLRFNLFVIKLSQSKKSERSLSSTPVLVDPGLSVATIVDAPAISAYSNRTPVDYAGINVKVELCVSPAYLKVEDRHSSLE